MVKKANEEQRSLSSAPKVHNLLRFSILIRLNQSPAHGYQLIQELKTTLLHSVSASHVYPFLRELEQKKWIGVRKVKRTNVFFLTPSGKKQVESLLDQFSGMLRAALSARISACTHCGCKVFESGYRHKGKTYCCNYCAKAERKK